MNRIVHFEIQTDNIDRAQKFYRDVFGWKIDDMGADYGNYRVVTTGTETPGINGGMTTRVPGLGSANAYVCVIAVNDIDEYIQKALTAGATMALEKMDVSNVGLLAYFKDTEGNTFGILQPAPSMNQ